jgi:hypothetical protein
MCIRPIWRIVTVTGRTSVSHSRSWTFFQLPRPVARGQCADHGATQPRALARLDRGRWRARTGCRALPPRRSCRNRFQHCRRDHQAPDNNAKNALFADSDGGGRTWATVATLLQTEKMNDVDPVRLADADARAPRQRVADLPDRKPHVVELQSLNGHSLALTNLLVAAADVGRQLNLARWSLRAACLPPLSVAFSSSRSAWLNSTRYREYLLAHVRTAARQSQHAASLRCWPPSVREEPLGRQFAQTHRLHPPSVGGAVSRLSFVKSRVCGRRWRLTSAAIESQIQWDRG